MRFPILLTGIISSAIAGTSLMAAIEDRKQAERQPPWSCYTASDAEPRKKQVGHFCRGHMLNLDCRLSRPNHDSILV